MPRRRSADARRSPDFRLRRSLYGATKSPPPFLVYRLTRRAGSEQTARIAWAPIKRSLRAKLGVCPGARRRSFDRPIGCRRDARLGPGARTNEAPKVFR